MRRIVVAVAVISLLVAGGFATASGANGNMYKHSGRANPMGKGEHGILERIRNQICDMLGGCDGNCTETTEITDVLTYNGTYFYVDNVKVHFGPTWYITITKSAVDYDKDGTNELLIGELHGLVGTTVTLEGFMHSENRFSVFKINGEVYREPGKPIWANGHHNGHH